ncbi:MAG: hypothetical protein JXM79_00390 [Sedimentisphaerales bacterium]|nr:hypothetical protein [Sedimentisphaerales bacterium]
MTVQELIDNLPDAVKPMAELWLPVIRSWSQDQIGQWLKDIMTNWQEGYYQLVKGMDVANRKVEHARLNEAIEQSNNDWAAFVETQQEMILTLFAGLLTKVMGA